MFKIPDRVADLFGDDTIRADFQQALLATGQVHGYGMKYLEEAAFSEAARLTHGHLKEFDVATLPEEKRELVAGSKALSHRLVTSGYAINEVVKAGDCASDDWAELLAFARQKCEDSARVADDNGWERCYTYILDRAEAALEPNRPAEDHDAGYAVLRHFASFYNADSGFKRRWFIQVPTAD